MRGDDQQQSGMFSYVSLEERVPGQHPLRAIRKSVDEVLRGMSKEFDAMYASKGRPVGAAGAVVAGGFAADLLFRSERADADGAVGVQPAVPLVRRHGDGCAGMEPLIVRLRRPVQVLF